MPKAPKPPAPPPATENEVMRETRLMAEAKAAAEAAQHAAATASTKAAAPAHKGPGWRTAAGFGIGSAALLAALLYANRKK